jgi:tetratricopeptide (TPR) repeat protein
MHSAFSLKPKCKQTGRRILCPVLLSGIIFFAVITSAFSSISYDLLKKGREKMDDKDYVGAIVYLESAYKADPDDKTVHVYLGVAYHNLAVLNSQKGELENAIRNGLHALRFDPESSIIKEQLSVFYNNLALQQVESEKYKQARENLQRALELSPDSEVLTKNMYNMLLKYADEQFSKKNSRAAIRTAKDAAGVLPDLPDAYIFIGNVYYKQDNFRDALMLWEKAFKIDPSNEKLKGRIDALKREKKVEGEFETEREAYFRIRFDKELDTRYVGRILDILKRARLAIRDKFGFYSNDVIPVIVYDDKQFRQATDQPHWTQGLYDGKIRLRYQDISRGEENLERVLFHEYAHAMIFLNIGVNIPLWLNEGFAQYSEPEFRFTASDKIFLAGYVKNQKKFSLEGLDAMFAKKDDHGSIRAAYLESRLFFDYLIEKFTKHRMRRLLEELKGGKQWQEAFTAVYQVSVDRMEKKFNNYLDDLLR